VLLQLKFTVYYSVIVHSCKVHPCNFLHYCPLLHCQLLQFQRPLTLALQPQTADMCELFTENLFPQISLCHLEILRFKKFSLGRGQQAIIFCSCGFFYLLSLLWSPYGIGQTIIFLPCGFFFFLLSFFPRLISAAADWMSAILPHMVWP